MHHVEEKAVQTYKCNMDFLEKEHNNLFKKINLLNMAIENNQYIEKYTLEYKDDYFDIKELKSQQYLYNENSNKISKQVAKRVNFTKTDNIIEAFYNTLQTKQQAQIFNDTIEIIESPLYATSNIVNYTRSIIDKSTTLKRIEKYIYFGVGIGKHLEIIQDKVKASKVLIVEDNIELFRLSLFTTDYSDIFKNIKIFYSVAENEVEFKETFNDFFTSGYNHNQYLKYTIFSDNYISKIKQIQDNIVIQGYISYPYSIRLKNLLQSPQYLVDGYNYLNISIKEEDTFFSDKPIMLIAAGPSLGKNIEWLKKNKSLYCIVSVLASIQTLYEHNIKPDIVVNIDSSNILTKFFNGIDVENFLSETLFLFSSMTNQKIINMLQKKSIFFFESVSSYKIDFGKLTAPSVGETTYGLLLNLGAKEIYLLGLDLALDPETKEQYTNKENKQCEIIKENEDIYNTQIGKSITYVKGNFLNQVPTLALFKTSIFDFNILSEILLINNQKVYNLNNGAYLNGTIPLKIEDIDTKNFNYIDKESDTYKNNLYNFFKENSENIPNEKDVDNINKQINEAIRLSSIMQEYKSIKSYSNLDTYMLNFAKVINELVVPGKIPLDINLILYSYIRFLSPYIFDFFNTKELSNHKKHIKYINKTFIQQTEKILNIYIKTLILYRNHAENKLEGK